MKLPLMTFPLNLLQFLHFPLLRSQYGAEKMSLVVLGGEPLDTLEDWVRKLLSTVPSGVGPPTSFHDHGYPFEVSLAPPVQLNTKRKSGFKASCFCG